MIRLRLKVWHVRQDVFESWEFCSIRGWLFVDKAVADDWRSGSFRFHELHHDNERRSSGVFGPVVGLPDSDLTVPGGVS